MCSCVIKYTQKVSQARYRSTPGSSLPLELMGWVKASLEVIETYWHDIMCKLICSFCIDRPIQQVHKYNVLFKERLWDTKETEGFPTASVMKAAFESHFFNLSPGFIFLASHRRAFLTSMGALFRSMRRKFGQRKEVIHPLRPQQHPKKSA